MYPTIFYDFPKCIQSIINEYTSYPLIKNYLTDIISNNYVILNMNPINKNNTLDSPYYWKILKKNINISHNKLWYEYYINNCNLKDIYFFTSDSFKIIAVNMLDNVLLVKCNYHIKNIKIKVLKYCIKKINIMVLKY